MMKTRVIPYRQGSKSAKSIAEALGGKVLLLSGSKYQRKVEDRIINWGHPDPMFTDGVLNGTGIREASNKLSFFQLVHACGEGDVIPDFWTDIGSIPDDAFPVVCRTVLAGHSGEGIVIADTRDQLVPCGLYVKYVKKKHEFRIHVGRWSEKHGYPYTEGGTPEGFATIISEQKKSRRLDCSNPNWRIRNHDNGFVFKREGIVVPELVRQVAKRALMVTRLDFGAVDVIWNAGHERAYVLEINTAPGLEGQTIEDYRRFFEGSG